MNSRRRRACAATCLAATVWTAAGCTSSGPRGAPSSAGSGPATAGTGPSSSGTPASSAASSAAGSASPSAPASSSAAPGARLAYVTSDGVELATLTAAGALIGRPVRIGPGDMYSDPIWSPQGRYLAWSVGTAAGENRNLEIYDSAQGSLAQVEVPGYSDVSGDGTGAIAASLDPNDGHLAVTMYDRTGKPSTPSEPPLVGQTGDVAVGHDLLVVASRDPNADPAAPSTLTLVVRGKATRVGQVVAVPFLGMQITPGIGLAAVRSDDSQIAVTTHLGQDGVCAVDGVVHVVDVAAGTDQVVALPADPAAGSDGSTVRLANASYSPEGVLGGILSNCGFEGSDKANVFVELQGGTWQQVLPGVVVATRGPGGLLAAEPGSYVGHEGAAIVTPSAPLAVTDANGRTTATLAQAWTAAWAPSAVAPD